MGPPWVAMSNTPSLRVTVDPACGCSSTEMRTPERGAPSASRTSPCSKAIVVASNGALEANGSNSEGSNGCPAMPIYNGALPTYKHAAARAKFVATVRSSADKQPA